MRQKLGHATVNTYLSRTPAVQRAAIIEEYCGAKRLVARVNSSLKVNS